MREIRFKGKRIDGEWVYGVPYTKEIFSVEEKRIVSYKTFIITYLGDDLLSVDKEEVIPETIGQFTGLLDKNGKEIYEGDIVKVKVTQRQDLSLYGDVTISGIIRYDDEHPLFTMKGNFLNFVNWSYNGEIEIIGNIHESVKE